MEGRRKSRERRMNYFISPVHYNVALCTASMKAACHSPRQRHSISYLTLYKELLCTCLFVDINYAECNP